MEALKSDITFSKDIVKAVAKRTGFSEDKVKHVLDFMLFFIKKKAKEPNVYSVRIPFVGVLYMKTYALQMLLKEREKRNTVSKKSREIHVKLKEKVKRLHEEHEKLQKEVGDIVYTPHKYRRTLTNWYFTKRMTKQELEEYQNG